MSVRWTEQGFLFFSVLSKYECFFFFHLFFLASDCFLAPYTCCKNAKSYITMLFFSKTLFFFFALSLNSKPDPHDATNKFNKKKTETGAQPTLRRD
jgi:hypothetical protein